MAKKYGDIVNTNDTAFVGAPITLNTTTATTILAAQDLTVDQPRIKVVVQNEGTTPIKVRLMPAAIEPTIKKGMAIAAGAFATIIDAPNVYTGEISAFATVGVPKASVTWF